MKNHFITIILACGLLFSCTDTKTDIAIPDKKQIKVDYIELDSSEMNEITLVEYDLNMSIRLPYVADLSGDEITPKIIHEDGDYLWYINIGEYFHLVIEDYAMEFNKVNSEKKRLLAKSDIFKIDYLIDGNNLIYYKKQLNATINSQPTYHCFGEVKIDGYNYILRTEDQGTLKPIAQDMVSSIKSAKGL